MRWRGFSILLEGSWPTLGAFGATRYRMADACFAVKCVLTSFI